MMANVVVAVNTSMSAAASTPVYLAMTGAAARSVICRGGFHPAQKFSLNLMEKGTGSTLASASFTVASMSVM